MSYANNSIRFFIANSALALSACFIGPAAVAEVEIERLNNAHVSAAVTPDIGGRLLFLAAPGFPNVLRVSEDVDNHPHPQVTPEAENIGYLGGEVWLGPQSGWWQQQRVNLKRLQEKANWPPDPYLILSRYEVLNRSPAGVVLESPASPVTGVRLRKDYALDAQGLRQTVLATNVRDSIIAWDLWFTNRISADAVVYVPVADQNQVREAPLADADFTGVQIHYEGGYARVAPRDSADVPTQGQRGKLFIQPDTGFIAAFTQGQLLLVEFDWLDADLIHPEHGQVELYVEAPKDRAAPGLIELEIHGAFDERAPKSVFSLTQRLRVLPYTGAANAAAEREFLERVRSGNHL